jgi:hypothetical protein
VAAEEVVEEEEEEEAEDKERRAVSGSGSMCLRDRVIEAGGWD